MKARFKQWISIFAAVSLLLGMSTAVPGKSYAAFWNLNGAIVTHDPSIIKEGDIWWNFATGSGLPVSYSLNGGTTWNTGVPIFSQPLSWWSTYVPNQTYNDVWAPDVKTYNGKVWLYYSISTFGSNTSAIGLMSATSIIQGDWVDHGLVIRSNSSTSYNAIDPNLVIDANGDPWLAFGSWFDGIKITRLDKTTMKPTGTIYSIAKRSNGIEGAYIVYRNGVYTMFASIDNCCQGVNSTYKIVVGQSKSITGPYLDKNGVNMMNGGGTIFDAGNSVWKGPGGQSVYGTSVIARHAYDATDNGTPKLLINDLYWDSSGWPTY